MPKLTLERTKLFEWPVDGDDAKIEIKHLKPGVISKIEAKVNRFVGKMSDEDQNFTTELDINPHARKQEIVKESIVSWEGFIGLDGKNVKCTNTNKLMFLMEFSDEDFYDIIEKLREELAKEVGAEMEGHIPN